MFTQCHKTESVTETEEPQLAKTNTENRNESNSLPLPSTLNNKGAQK